MRVHKVSSLFAVGSVDAQNIWKDEHNESNCSRDLGMRKWADNAILISIKPEPPTRSWWADRDVQTDRSAFDQTATIEALRMKTSHFGGAKKIHDDGVK